MARLGGHVDPFLALLAPLWVLWPSPLMLALAQIVAVSLGALPVFWLGRRHLGSESAAGLLALGYLAYPWTATSAAASIHPVTFAIPLYLFCIWFLDTDRLVPFALFALLAMSTGELMGLPIAALGVWYALARGRRLAGTVIAVAGAAWMFITPGSGHPSPFDTAWALGVAAVTVALAVRASRSKVELAGSDPGARLAARPA